MISSDVVLVNSKNQLQKERWITTCKNLLMRKSLLALIKILCISTVWTTKTLLSSTRTSYSILKVCTETKMMICFRLKRECSRWTMIERLWTDSPKWLKSTYQMTRWQKLLTKRKTCWQWFHSSFIMPIDLIWGLLTRHTAISSPILIGLRHNSSKQPRSRK